MTKKDVNVGQLATSVMWWLNYISAVGRSYVLNECAIKFPATEYLESSAIDAIELEYGHPKLLRKRFDLFFQKEQREKTVFEFKYIKNGSTRTNEERRRIFNDLMRLYLFLDTDKKGYFLICGNQFDFITDFQRIRQNQAQFIVPRIQGDSPEYIEPEGFYTKWFSFKTSMPEKKIDLNVNDDEYRTIYDQFFSEYSAPYKAKTNADLERPAMITTSLVFLSGNDEQPTGVFQPCKIGIWEILKD